MYLPAFRKIRRVADSNRGDSFLGTDLSFEEIKKENKVELSDYACERVGFDTVDGVETVVVEGVPVSDEVSRELGYSRVRWWIDPAIAIPRRSEFWDVGGTRLKTVHNLRIEDREGIWTFIEVFAENHQTGHSTRLRFDEVNYREEIDDAVFSQGRLRRGL